MKKSFVVFASAVLLMSSTSAFAESKITPKGNGQVEVICSQALLGPEKWDKQILPIDKNGYITIFNGKDFSGWRGYGKSYAPSKWEVTSDGCLSFKGKEAKQGDEGGDIIFAHKFKNFELSLEWKVAKGSNSGILYLAQEAIRPDGSGLEAIYESAPECQVLDNVNHPDAKLGHDGNRQSSSLYDMIPAKPQNAKPFGEWNQVKVRVENGVVTHFQNGKAVVQYKLWNQEWTAMLQNSKFSETKWPIAFNLLNNCGGPNHEGYIGLQDHGDRVWYRNIKVKVLD